MNLIQMGEALKSYPDAVLAQEAQQPSGKFPPFLIATELKRRHDLRHSSANAPQPSQTTVLQDLLGAQASPNAQPSPTPNMRQAAPPTGMPQGFAMGGPVYGPQKQLLPDPGLQFMRPLQSDQFGLGDMLSLIGSLGLTPSVSPPQREDEPPRRPSGEPDLVVPISLRQPSPPAWQGRPLPQDVSREIGHEVPQSTVPQLVDFLDYWDRELPNLYRTHGGKQRLPDQQKEAIIRGMMANIHAESRFRPDAWNHPEANQGTEDSRGFFQVNVMHGERPDMLYGMMKQHAPWITPDDMFDPMKSSQALNELLRNRPDLLSGMFAAQTPEDAARWWTKTVINPKNAKEAAESRATYNLQAIDPIYNDAVERVMERRAAMRNERYQQRALEGEMQRGMGRDTIIPYTIHAPQFDYAAGQPIGGRDGDPRTAFADGGVVGGPRRWSRTNPGPQRPAPIMVEDPNWHPDRRSPRPRFVPLNPSRGIAPLLGATMMAGANAYAQEPPALVPAPKQRSAADFFLGLADYTARLNTDDAKAPLPAPDIPQPSPAPPRTEPRIDLQQYLASMNPQPQQSQPNLYSKRLAEMYDRMAKAEQQNRWMALAQMGFNMAAGQSPYFATNVGAAGAAGLDAMAKGAANVEAMRDRALDIEMGADAMTRKEAADDRRYALDLMNAEAQIESNRQRNELMRERIRAAEMAAAARGAGGVSGKPFTASEITAVQKLLAENQHPLSLAYAQAQTTQEKNSILNQALNYMRISQAVTLPLVHEIADVDEDAEALFD